MEILIRNRNLSPSGHLSQMAPIVFIGAIFFIYPIKKQEEKPNFLKVISDQ